VPLVPPHFRRLCTSVTGCVIGNSHLPCPQEAEEGKAVCCPQHHYIWTYIMQDPSQVAPICLRILGLMVSLSLLSLFFSTSHFFTPRKIYSRRCSDGGVLVRGARWGILNLHCWHFVHSLQYCATSWAILIQYASCRNCANVFSKPWWPAVDTSWLRTKVVGRGQLPLQLCGDGEPLKGRPGVVLETFCAQKCNKTTKYCLWYRNCSQVRLSTKG